jgi:hypothetical protein
MLSMHFNAIFASASAQRAFSLDALNMFGSGNGGWHSSPIAQLVAKTLGPKEAFF